MQRITLSILLCCLFGVEAIRAATLKRVTRDAEFEVWRIENFPDPQSNHKACNRTVSSFICDPNDFLNDRDAQKLDNLIDNIKASTACACEDCSQGSGLSVGVAVFNNIYKDVRDDPKEKAEEFAKTLLTNWKLGSCGNAILVLLAVQTEQFVVVPGETVSKILNLTELEKMREAVKDYFNSTSSIYTGLESLLTSISDKVGNVQKSPFIGEQESGTNQGGMGLTIGLTVGFIALAALFAAGIVLLRRKRAAYLKSQQRHSRGPPIVKAPAVFADAVYQPCSVEDPAGNYDYKQTNDQELDEYSVPIKKQVDDHDSKPRKELSSVEEKENENDDDSSSREERVEFKHPKLRTKK